MAPSLTRADGLPLRVLVVDDEVNIAELLQMPLRYEGWDIRTAHTGRTAVATAREFLLGRHGSQAKGQISCFPPRNAPRSLR